MKNNNGEKKVSDFEEKRENVSLIIRMEEMRNMLAQEPKLVLMCTYVQRNVFSNGTKN